MCDTSISSDLITVFPFSLSLSLSCSLLVPVTEAVVRKHSWGKPAAFAGMPVLKCGTQQATLLPCGAGMVSTKRSCWACGGVGNLAYEAPAERQKRGKKEGKTSELRALAFFTHKSFRQLGSINAEVEESK